MAGKSNNDCFKNVVAENEWDTDNMELKYERKCYNNVLAGGDSIWHREVKKRIDSHYPRNVDQNFAWSFDCNKRSNVDEKHNQLGHQINIKLVLKCLFIWLFVILFIVWKFFLQFFEGRESEKIVGPHKTRKFH